MTEFPFWGELSLELKPKRLQSDAFLCTVGILNTIDRHSTNKKKITVTFYCSTIILDTMLGDGGIMHGLIMRTLFDSRRFEV